jgi:hypothetical protein
MTKYYLILILCLPLVNNYAKSQKFHKSINFVDIDSVMLDIQAKGSNSRYYKNVDFELILELDSTYKRQIEIIDPKYVELFYKINSARRLVSDQIIIPYTTTGDIRNQFLERKFQKKLLVKCAMEEDKDNRDLNSMVYLKDTNKAIFLIYGASYLKCYRLEVKNNDLIINFVYGIQE